MSALAEIYIKAETLKILSDTVARKGDKGLSITVSLSDTTNNYGQNVSSFVSQTKEQRDANTSKYYVGNGKIFWTDGKITKAEPKNQAEQAAPAPAQDEVNDLPF